MYGEAGNDLLEGETGNEDMSGAPCIDRLYSADGVDRLSDGFGRDRMSVCLSRGELFGGEDNATIGSQDKPTDVIFAGPATSTRW